MANTSGGSTIPTADSSFSQQNVIPHDRWLGVNYTGRKEGDPVMLLVLDHLSTFLFAFETPVFAMCPPPGGAGAPAGVASFVGL